MDPQWFRGQATWLLVYFSWLSSGALSRLQAPVGLEAGRRAGMSARRGGSTVLGCIGADGKCNTVASISSGPRTSWQAGEGMLGERKDGACATLADPVKRGPRWELTRSLDEGKTDGPRDGQGGTR